MPEVTGQEGIARLTVQLSRAYAPVPAGTDLLVVTSP